jgi:hypothetical protein
MGYGLVFVFLSVIVGVGAWIYMRNDAAKQRGDTPIKVSLTSKKVKSKANIKNLWDVVDVRRGVVVLSGNRYCLICRVSAADFWLLSDVEQNQVEDAAAAAMLQITFPIQTLITSQALDTRAVVEELRQSADRLPENLREMAYLRADYLDALTREKAASARQAYLVIPYDTVKGFDHAYRELRARLYNLADALAGAKVKIELLSTEAVIDLLAHMLNRGRSWKPSEAVRTGVMSLYTVSERSVASG